ncbi:MAG: hypothetical protein MZV64_47590 [Ignavibacteriales bacterium]|nr:hypothetical protein [Ignavibacteriales bacterium]
MIVAFKFFPDVNRQEKYSLKAHRNYSLLKIFNRLSRRTDHLHHLNHQFQLKHQATDVLEDIEIGDTEIDINEQMEAPPPPPKEDKKV